MSLFRDGQEGSQTKRRSSSFQRRSVFPIIRLTWCITRILVSLWTPHFFAVYASWNTFSQQFYIPCIHSLNNYFQHLHDCIKKGLGKLTKFAWQHAFIQYFALSTKNTRRTSEDFRTLDNCWPFPDVEYEDPGGLQEKLERLNAIMSTEWAASSANYGRRMQYLSNCEYFTYLFRLVSLWFFWNRSFGWLCFSWSYILDILEWFFLKKHYHGHYFPPLPP